MNRKYQVGFFQKRFFCIFTLIINILLLTPVSATYQVSKVRLFLSPQNPIDFITITNPDKEDASNLQLNLVKWTQQNGEDIYQPTNDLIVAPPLMRLSPGANQIVRIGWRTPAVSNEELTYRLFIQDISPFKKNAYSIQFKIRLSIPIFISPPKPLQQIEWFLKKTGSNQAMLIINNNGNVHLQVARITLKTSQDKLIGVYKTPFYVLAKQKKEIPVTISVPGGNIVLIADTDSGQMVNNVMVY